MDLLCNSRTGECRTASSTSPSFLTTSTYSGSTITLSNQQTMNQQQVKVAVFKVTRNKEGKVTSSTFLSELWIEKKHGVSIDYAVAKQIKEDLSPDQIVIKEIYTLTF